MSSSIGESHSFKSATFSVTLTTDASDNVTGLVESCDD